jgi:hypothetical protein
MSRRHLGACGAVLSSEVFDSFVGALLPVGGVVVAIIQAFFDESYGEKVGSILCVAGYMMTDRAARRLTREWNAVLREYDLPYFRMSACAHGNYPFNKLTKNQRVAVETKMIGLIKRRTIKGIGVTVNVDEFGKIMPDNREVIGGAYSVCLNVVLGGAYHWAKHMGFTSRLAYFFEAGHNNQSEADRILTRAFSMEDLRTSRSYAGHGFVRKEDSPPTQAADILAWQWYTDLRHKIEGKKRRADCASLLEHDHDVRHIPPEFLLALVLKWNRIRPGLDLDFARFALSYKGDGG